MIAPGGRARRSCSGVRESLGFSLLEVLLAMALGVLLTTAVAGLFASSARGYALHSGHARLQESARLALHFLAVSARSAGYHGCGAAGNLADGLADTWRADVTRNIAMPVAGVDNLTGAGDVHDWDLGARQFKPGSDVVLFRRLAGLGHDLARPFDSAGELVLARPFEPKPGQLAVLSDCGRLGLLDVESIARNGRVRLGSSVDVAALEAVNSPYGEAAGPAAAVVGPVVAEIYFIARSRYVNNRGDRGWSLWRDTGRADEVVSGVDDLQLLYGIDTTPDDGDPAPQRYVRADGIAAGLVRTVRITVTVSSVDAVTDGDEPLSRSVSQTVALRNRWVAM